MGLKHLTQINPEDLIIDVYRHPKNWDSVNVGAYCVRIKHKPSGIVVKSEDRVPSSVNQERALKLLELKLAGPV